METYFPVVVAILVTLGAVSEVESTHAYDTLLSTSDMIKKCIDKAVRDVKKQKALEKKFYLQGNDCFPENGAFSWHHSKFMGIEDPDKIQLLNKKASIVLRAIKYFEQMSGISLEELKGDNGLKKIWQKAISPHCNCPKPKCNNRAHYRTADGTCNNVKNPKWGSSFIPQFRYLPPAYHDGVNRPRLKSVSGDLLPSARHISNVIHSAEKCQSSDRFLTMMFMSWGQFLDHDFIGTPMTKGFNDSTILCCKLSPTTLVQRESCFPIKIPSDDPYFKYQCMEFVRSSAAPLDNCVPEWRNQINQHTSFVDGSMMYGASVKEARSLRTGYDGLLKVTIDGMLPEAKKSECIMQKRSDYCFQAGDKRNMVVPSLTYLHLLFVREHNRITSELSAINPHWSDETLYQQTRKIVIAIIQHITYKEYLTFLLPKDIRTKYGLTPKIEGHSTVYNPKVNPSISNVFGVAAFRFGHSQIPNHQVLFSTTHTPIQVKPIEKTFNRPFLTLSHNRNGRGYDGVGRWLVNDFMSPNDKCLEDGVRNKLFLDKQYKSFDLAALNIQRGRDHGIPSYNAWRKFCGLKPVVHFGSGPGGMVDHDEEDAEIFHSLYRHPDDMDLYPAAMSERHLPGGLLGPTFSCLVAKQFNQLKTGDRFWYENEFLSIGFNRAQLNEIKKIKLSRVVCDNTEIKEVQKFVFTPPSIHNELYPCMDRRYSINLELWREIPKGSRGYSARRSFHHFINLS